MYGFEVGDYARVTATNHFKNEITVQMEDGREVTYNPARLSGVNVYQERDRAFSEGDRIQFRAPFAEHRIANGELGTIKEIKDDEVVLMNARSQEVKATIKNDYIFAMIGGDKPTKFLEAIGIKIG